MPSKRPPRELRVYLLKNPDFFAKAVAARSEKDAIWALGGPVSYIEEPKLLKKLRRRPGVVFMKLAGTKKDWEVWGR